MSWASFIPTAIPLATTPWFGWRRTFPCATRSSTGRGTSVRSTAIQRPPIATPSAAWKRSARNCWPTSTSRPSISSPTTTTRKPSPRCCQRACPTCWLTAPPASRWGWPPISPRTTYARSSMRPSRSSATRTSTSTILSRSSRGPTFPPPGSSAVATASARPTNRAAAASWCGRGPRWRNTPRAGANPSWPPRSRTRSTKPSSSRKSRNWCARRRSTASPTCATNRTARACGLWWI